MDDSLFSTEAESIVTALRLTPDVLEARLAAMDLSSQHRARLREVAPQIEARLAEFITHLYARLQADRDTEAFLSNERQIAYLKDQQTHYVRELFSAEITWEYALRRLRLGAMHHRIRLKPQWYIATFAHFICDHVDLLLQAGRTRSESLDLILTLLKTIFFDASLVLDAYGHVEAFTRQRGEVLVEPLTLLTLPDEWLTATQGTTTNRPAMLAQLRLTSDIVAQRRAFIGISEQELLLLQSLRQEVIRATPDVLEDFYQFFSTFADTSALVPPAVVERLKQQVASYWRELVDNDFDRSYAASRMRIGVVHERIGLSSQWYLTGLVRQIAKFFQSLFAEHDAPGKYIKAFVRAVFFDMAFVIDVYMEARAEALLRTEGYANQLVAGLSAAVVILDQQDRIISANHKFVALAGEEAELLYHLPLAEAIPLPEASKLVSRLRAERLARVIGTGRLGTQQFRCTAMTLKAGAQPQTYPVALVLDDITDVLRISSDIGTMSNRFEELIHSVNAVLWEMDLPSWTMIAMSRPVLMLTGFRDVHFLGRREAWLDCMPPSERDRFKAQCNALELGATAVIEHRLRRADGREIWVCSHLAQTSTQDGSAVVFGVSVDITAARLAEKLRTEAIGQLAGGVAHIINNALMAVMGAVELQANEIGGLEQAPLLQTALEATQRAAAVTSSLLTFAGRQVMQSTQAHLGELVTAAARQWASLLGEDIQVEFHIATALWLCSVDPDKLEAALLCLVKNASEAMPAGGHLRISIQNTQRHTLPESDPGSGEEWVEIGISDDGCGMSVEVRRRAFEPFFTTKRPGQGDGLGLSIVYGFMMQSGGHTVIESQEGHGTTVKLRFPRLLLLPDPSRTPTTAAPIYTVLIVEDEELVRQVTARMLRSLEYAVVAVKTAQEALEVIAGRKIDVLFTDVLLGTGANGMTLARQVAQAHPDIAIVLTSGYGATHFSFADLPSHTQFIAKPFSSETLRQGLATAVAWLSREP